MSILVVFLYALTVVISLLLIGIILIQPSKSGGMGAAFGGVGESVFGGKAGSHLTKATVVMTAIFFVITLVLAALIGHGVRIDGHHSSVEENLPAGSASAQTGTAPNPAPVTNSAPTTGTVPNPAPVTNPAPTSKPVPAK